MGEYRESSRDAIGGSDWDRIIHGRPHAQERAKTYKKRCPNDAAVPEGEKPAAIHQRMVTVYGKKCVSDKSVRKRSACFLAVRESVGDDQRSGQANTIITNNLIEMVGVLVRSDRRVTLPMLAPKVDVSYGTVWTMVHDML
ncbi:HTH_48 domain-containing protein [Trichonephila inaurata madagascariensis]|uniref:HTH_48 domain-containing protein n=1 Tax=Trichonephila inaurata madagascariensis TaxID=2747483 RepID=A0A8X6YQ89_9ARAC|nr:HTH_48 domain-containing protein [Trichonephila inaurata madagascariensis]